VLFRSAAAAPAAPASAPSEAAREALFGVAKEQREEVPARVVGSIPAWLKGSLVVNGGAPPPPPPPLTVAAAATAAAVGGCHCRC
jgi:carotenoid cleavage dioxygenase-like enzyme